MLSNENRIGSIINSATILTGVSIITLCFSFIKESVIANYYGTSYAADAYVVAVDIPMTIFTFVSAAVSTVIIPIYSRELLKKGKDSATYFVSNFTTIIFIILSVILLMAEVFAKDIVLLFSPGLAVEVSELANSLLRITLLSTFCAVLKNINAGILNTHKDFLGISLSPNICNLSIILYVFVFFDSCGIYAAAIGTVIGAVLEYVYTCILKRKYQKYSFVLDFKHSATNEAVKMAIPVCVGMGAVEINKIVDKVVASFLVTGSISALHYASKISSGLSNVLINAIATVTFPEMSECVAKGNKKEAANIYMITLKIFFLLLIPITLGGIWLSEEIIIMVYGRGSFTRESIEITAPVLAWYLTCLLFNAIKQIASRLFYSYGDSKTPMKNSIIGIIINIILNIVLAKLFGVVGLAMATTISTAITSILLMRDIKSENSEIRYLDFIRSLKKMIISLFFMILILWLVRKVALSLNIYDSQDIVSVIGFTLTSISFGAISYLATLIVLQDKDIIGVMKQLKIKK